MAKEDNKDLIKFLKTISLRNSGTGFMVERLRMGIYIPIATN